MCPFQMALYMTLHTESIPLHQPRVRILINTSKKISTHHDTTPEAHFPIFCPSIENE